MLRKVSVFVIVFTLLVGGSAFASTVSGKKVLAIDSYHTGYPWSDGIVEGIQNVLNGSGVELKVIHMDTKRHTSEEFKKEAAAKAKGIIESYKPDVVIACDDNATKYLLMPSYRESKIPFVFCGLNWDASNYNLPYSNTTGMVEVGMIKQVIMNLRGYAKGDRVGYLTSDVLTEHKEAEYYGKLLDIHFAKEEYVKTLAEWKEAFARMQDQVDILIVSNNAGINDWDEKEASEWALSHGRVPTGTTYDWMVPYAMLGLTKVASEQGIWSAQAALEILGGKSPSSIPIVKNRKGDIFANVKLASKAGVIFKPALLKNATVIK